MNRTRSLNQKNTMGPRRLPEDDALTCLVCMNVLCDPVTLQPCGHSFCAHCVDARLDAGHADCALCQHGIEGTLLDFSLKAAVEERHAAALASRRASLQVPERTIFSRTPRVHAIGFLHLVTNVWPWMDYETSRTPSGHRTPSAHQERERDHATVTIAGALLNSVLSPGRRRGVYPMHV